MNRKWILAGTLILAKIVVLIAIIFAAKAGFGEVLIHELQWNLFRVESISVSQDMEWSFDTIEAAELVVDNNGGNITIQPGNSNSIKVEALVVAWGRTTDLAQEALEDMRIDVSQDGNKVLVRFYPPAIRAMGTYNRYSADLTITVPVDTYVDANTDSGSIKVNGLSADVVLATGYGELEVTDIQGSVRAETDSGEINAERLNAGEGRVELLSDYGDITLEGVFAESLEIQTGSGSIVLEKSDIDGSADLTTGFGRIQFTGGGAGSLQISTDSGEIELVDIKVENGLSAEGNFGDIKLNRASASSYNLDTDSGWISIEGCSGEITAVTGFGDITVHDAVEAQLNLESDSGKVIFEGSLGTGPHHLETNYGDIEIFIPDETALTVDLKTGFGDITSEFSVTVSGELDEKHWAGTVNGGGSELTAQTDSGSITFGYLDSENNQGRQ